MSIRPDLPQTADEVNNKNTLNSYFPIRTKDSPGVIDWESVLGHVIKITYRKSIGKGDLASFKEQCHEKFLAKLDEEDFWPVIEEMYFSKENLFEIAPELLLFKAQKIAGSSPNERLGSLYSSLLQSFFFKDKPEVNLNFIENDIYTMFNQYVSESKDKKASTKLAKETPYLPFLANNFQQDLAFLGSRPKYFLSVLKDFLKLYAFLYTAQLAINLKDWRSGKPKPKPLYFIIDNEKASDERSLIKDYGYKPMSFALWNIFPYLAMNESLQDSKTTKVPLWEIAEYLNEYPDLTPRIQAYAEAFKERRELNASLSNTDNPNDALGNLLNLSALQFSRGETRHEINQKYVRTIESEMCGHFIQSRGRAGRVLVFNQDYLMLLTNLSIGEQPRLRFNELIKAFENRGVFFDKQSHQVLIEFYERIGNVERMSDSGDAVYVVKTV